MPTTWLSDRVRVALDRWRGWNPLVRDGFLAAAFLVSAFLPPLATMSAEIGDLPRRPADAFTVLLVLAQTVPLAVRVRWPVVCLAVVGASFAVYESLGYPWEFATVTLYVALYSAGAHQRRWRRVTAVAASAAYLLLVAVLQLLGSPDRPVDFAIYYLVLVAFWGLGAFVRSRWARGVELARRAVAAAARAERARLARELHDVVTHHVTAMVVQADATRVLAGSPDRVGTALTAIGGTGRRALTELRHLLDVLEATGESAPPAPVDRTVRRLVEQTRLGGQPVELTEPDDEPPLPAGVALAVYRVVQEGLTNAVKHAAGQPTAVRVGYPDGRIEVEVTTAATVPSMAEPSGGRGLTGLRDRLATLDGELTAGRQADGRFRLRAVIPLPERT